MRSRKQGSAAKRLLIAAAVGGMIALVAYLPGRLAEAQQIHRNGFAKEPLWVRGEDNVHAEEKAHDLTEQYAHSLPTSEHIQIKCGAGTNDANFAHYHYPTAPAPVTEELSASVWVKSFKSGIRLEARLVLPKERNPKQPDEPLTTTIVGDLYKLTGRWQRLELPRPVQLMKNQQQILKVQLNRPIDLTDAYIDRLTLNLYTGAAGMLDVWIDDLEIGPVRPQPSPPKAAPAATPTGSNGQHGPVFSGSHQVPVRLQYGRLTVGGKPFFFRAIRYSNTPLKTLRDAEFNTVWFDADTPTEKIEEAISHGFWIVPSIPLAGDRTAADTPGQAPGALTGRGRAEDLATARDAQALATAVRRFISGDSVLFWDLGGGRSAEQFDLVMRTSKVIKEVDPNRPRGADIWDGFSDYSNDLDLVGTHRFPLMTSLELTKYSQWLNQRQLLTKGGTFMWTWIQTHMPEWESKLLYDKSAADAFSEPVGPQPEQIRLMTYLSLANGVRGLGFWSDRFLADSHQGRDRLVMMALLNQEIRMLEPILLHPNGPAVWIDTSHKDVKAAVLRSEKGVMVMPVWLGGGAQYVPPQGAIANLTMVVPFVPDGTQPWEISPGRVQSLQHQCRRVWGGTQLTIPEFDLTAAVVFTGDLTENGLVVKWQDHSRRVATLAAQWAEDLAAAEYRKVAKVHAQLEELAPPIPQAGRLLDEAQRRLDDARAFQRNNDDQNAYLEALRALRPLRILMRAHWDNAVRSLDLPTASPYAVSFYTLPRHWMLHREVRATTVGLNALRDGDFEAVASRPNFRTTSNSSDAAAPSSQGVEVSQLPGWTVQSTTLDPVNMSALLVPSSVAAVPKPPRHETKRQPYDPSSPLRRIEPPEAPEPVLGQTCLKLEVHPKAVVSARNKKVLPAPAALERTFLAVNTPPVRLPPGSLVRISGWVRVPDDIKATADGVMFYDSAAGEGLAVRITEKTGWKSFHLYRRVPPSGAVWVTMALTGIGTAYFDDIRVEPLNSTDASARGSDPFAGGR